MNNESRSPGPKETAFKKLLAEIVAEHVDIEVEAERERCAVVARNSGCLGARAIADKIMATASHQQPPAPEPMTITKLMKILRRSFGFEGVPDGYDDWVGVEANLTALVEAQAWRDVHFISNVVGLDGLPVPNRGYITNKLRESAGLK